MSSMRSCLIVPMTSINDTKFTSGAGTMVFDFADAGAIEKHAPLLRRAREVNCSLQIIARLPRLDDPFSIPR